MTEELPKNLEYISDIKDATKREFKGYYDKESEKYYLTYINKDGELDFLSKISHDIGEDLFDPFAELKIIHAI